MDGNQTQINKYEQFSHNISHKLLRPSQFLEEFMEIQMIFAKKSAA